jgi:hypothetical protein
MSNEIPPEVQALLDAGWGRVEINNPGDGRPISGFHFLSFADMERMGEEERIRLGVQATYLFALEKQAEGYPPTT